MFYGDPELVTGFFLDFGCESRLVDLTTDPLFSVLINACDLCWQIAGSQTQCVHDAI